MPEESKSYQCFQRNGLGPGIGCLPCAFFFWTFPFLLGWEAVTEVPVMAHLGTAKLAGF